MSELPTDLIPVAEGRKLLQLSRASFYRWLRAGRLRSWRRGIRLFVRRADVAAVFELRPVAVPGES